MKNSKSGSSLILMEIIITIFFFMICSALCIKIFVSSHVLNEETTDINKATVMAESFADVFRSQGGDIEKCLDIYPYATLWDDGHFTIYYSEGFEECSVDDALYVLNGYFTNDGMLSTADISVSKCTDDHEIYKSTICKAVNYNR